MRITVALDGPTQGVFDWKDLQKEFRRTFGRSAAHTNRRRHKKQGKSKGGGARSGASTDGDGGGVGIQDSGAALPGLDERLQARLEARLTGSHGSDASASQSKRVPLTQVVADDTDVGSAGAQSDSDASMATSTANKRTNKKHKRQKKDKAKKGKGKHKGKGKGKGKGKKKSHKSPAKHKGKGHVGQVGQGGRNLQDVIMSIESRVVQQPEGGVVGTCVQLALQTLTRSHTIATDDYYDVDDPFIDDSELVAQMEVHEKGKKQKAKRSGFYVLGGNQDIELDR